MDSSLKSIAYLYIHFSFSTDDELSVNEIDMISEKVNDIFNPDKLFNCSWCLIAACIPIYTPYAVRYDGSPLPPSALVIPVT